MKWLCAIFLATFVSTATADVASDLAGPFATTAAKIQLKERGELARRVEPLLLFQAKALLAQLKPWDQDPTAALLFKGTSGEFDIRSNGHLAYGLATIYRAIPADVGAGPERDVARDRAIAILKFLLPTHGAGGKFCTDGKQWHDQWQSALWAHSAGNAAWLLWDDLDPQLKWLAARMITDEADRFIDVKPPSQVQRDTKAEENAWNSQVIALASAMFPNHPHHKVWRETAIRWAISSFVTAQDTKSDQVIDGKHLKDWLSGPNIYDDFTLENHDRVHPDYMGTIRINLSQKLDYDWGGQPEPAGIRYNTKNVYSSLMKLAFPDGGFIYPNGQDWQIHRVADWIDLHAAMAILFNDRQAARMLRNCIETVEKMAARNLETGIFEPNEILVPTSNAIPMELYSDAYFFMRQGGDGPAPADDNALWHELAGKHVFAAGSFAVLRTQRSISTFSWGRQVMGMCVPLQKDLLFTPNERSFIGMITMADGKQDVPLAKKIGVAETTDALGITGVIERAGGAIEQRFAFVALGDGRTVYTDVLQTVGDAKIASMNLGTLGILNEKSWVYHDGTRRLHYPRTQTAFPAVEATEDAKPVKLSSPWYNLDGIGIICLKTSGEQVYNVKPSNTRGRLEQLFHLNHVDPGATPSTAIIFYPDQPRGQTPVVAARCKFEPGRDPLHFAITLHEGKRIDVDLQQLKLAIK